MFTPPTPTEKLAWTGFYSIITVAGVIVLTMPPRTIEGPLGEWLTLAWGTFLCVAAIPAVATMTGKYRWEYATLPLVIAGVLIYASMIWHLTAHTPTRLAQALLITALAVALTNRWLHRRRQVQRDQATKIRDDPKNTLAG